jgi:uncharacterized protein
MPAIFSALLFCLISMTARAEFSVPALTGPVVDQAKILRPETVDLIGGAFRRLKERGGSQINILTVESLGGETIEQASIKVVDQWKLGTGKLDNGVLFLISRDDRKMRIEVGQGLEGNLTDLHSKRIIEDTVAPAFREGKFDEGVLMGAVQIIQRTDPEIDPNELFQGTTFNRRHPTVSNDGFGNWLFIALIILFILSRIIFGGPRRFGPRYSGWGGGGFGGGGFGGGGGGSWGGGGGGFSGGGASGGW